MKKLLLITAIATSSLTAMANCNVEMSDRAGKLVMGYYAPTCTEAMTECQDSIAKRDQVQTRGVRAPRGRRAPRGSVVHRRSSLVCNQVVVQPAPRPQTRPRPQGPQRPHTRPQRPGIPHIPADVSSYSRVDALNALNRIENSSDDAQRVFKFTMSYVDSNKVYLKPAVEAYTAFLRQVGGSSHTTSTLNILQAALNLKVVAGLGMNIITNDVVTIIKEENTPEDALKLVNLVKVTVQNNRDNYQGAMNTMHSLLRTHSASQTADVIRAYNSIY